MLIATKGAQERLKVPLHGLKSLSPVGRGSALLALALAALLALLAAACGGEAGTGAEAGPSDVVGNTSPEAPITITTYRSPTWECCSEYAGYLHDEGFQVETVMVDDMTDIKDDLGVPQHMRSCHTSMVGGYFVEGHVPLEAIRKLLDERPAIDGLALPGMPPGSPGMGGAKSEPFVIYSIVDGGIDEFVTL
jgi:hypothetical protein